MSPSDPQNSVKYSCLGASYVINFLKIKSSYIYSLSVNRQILNYFLFSLSLLFSLIVTNIFVHIILFYRLLLLLIAIFERVFANWAVYENYSKFEKKDTWLRLFKAFLFE